MTKFGVNGALAEDEPADRAKVYRQLGLGKWFVSG